MGKDLEFRGVSAGWVLPRRDGAETGEKVAVQGVCCEPVFGNSLKRGNLQGIQAGRSREVFVPCASNPLFH